PAKGYLTSGVRLEIDVVPDGRSRDAADSLCEPINRLVENRSRQRRVLPVQPGLCESQLDAVPVGAPSRLPVEVSLLPPSEEIVFPDAGRAYDPRAAISDRQLDGARTLLLNV